jgi:hypothetical protein
MFTDRAKYLAARSLAECCLSHGKPRLPYVPVIATSGHPSGSGMAAFGKQMRDHPST